MICKRGGAALRSFKKKNQTLEIEVGRTEILDQSQLARKGRAAFSHYN